jgi:hypothetical protein
MNCVRFLTFEKRLLLFLARRWIFSIFKSYIMIFLLSKFVLVKANAHSEGKELWEKEHAFLKAIFWGWLLGWKNIFWKKVKLQRTITSYEHLENGWWNSNSLLKVYWVSFLKTSTRPGMTILHAVHRAIKIQIQYCSRNSLLFSIIYLSNSNSNSLLHEE